MAAVSWVALVCVIFLVTVGLFLYQTRCRSIENSVQLKDRLENHVDALANADTSPLIWNCPEGALCLFEIDGEGRIVNHSGMELSSLQEESNRVKFANSIKSGLARDGRYLYLRDPGFKSSVAVYLKAANSQNNTRKGLGVAVLSGCKMKPKSTS